MSHSEKFSVSMTAIFCCLSMAQNISVGSIAAIFAYCYTVCKSLVRCVMESHKVASFLISLGSYLIALLVRAKFYDWLSSQGGWVSH